MIYPSVVYHQSVSLFVWLFVVTFVRPAQRVELLGTIFAQPNSSKTWPVCLKYWAKIQRGSRNMQIKYREYEKFSFFNQYLTLFWKQYIKNSKHILNILFWMSMSILSYMAHAWRNVIGPTMICRWYFRTCPVRVTTLLVQPGFANYGPMGNVCWVISRIHYRIPIQSCILPAPDYCWWTGSVFARVMCRSVRPSADLFLKMIRFTSGNDQNVPLLSLYCPPGTMM